ncbi:MAG: tetratricopeptide repeat protein [Bacteroidetes bacterium]|nr:tetratricopeptide repeat protein [Bacteroidota bacterium]
MNKQIPDNVYAHILQLSEEGNAYADNERYDEAVKKFNEALSLLPSPKIDWEASLWLYASIGDMFYQKKEFQSSKDVLYNALNCPGGIENPFVYLRLGECLYECGEMNKAKEYILRAYLLEGEEIFKSEDEKYFELIREII